MAVKVPYIVSMLVSLERRSYVYSLNSLSVRVPYIVSMLVSVERRSQIGSPELVPPSSCPSFVFFYSLNSLSVNVPYSFFYASIPGTTVLNR